MSFNRYDPALIAALHADRIRRLRQDTRLRRPRPGHDDRRWG